MTHLVGALFAVFATLGFSSRAIFIKLVYQDASMDPTTLMALRMLFSVPFFILMILWSKKQTMAKTTGGSPPFSRNDWLKMIGLGLLGFYLSSFLDLSGLQYIPASLERLILFLYPTIVVVISVIHQKRKITRKELFAITASYAGISFVFIENLSAHPSKDSTWMGALLIFAAAVTYAFYLSGSQGLVKKVGSTSYTGWVMLVSSVAAILQFFLFHPPALLCQSRPVLVWGLIAVIALFGTVLPTWMLAEALKRIGANQTALICTVGPVITLGLDAWLLDIPVSGIQMMGAFFVIAGVTVISIHPTPSPVKS